MGVQIGLDGFLADEFIAILVLEEERDLLGREKSPDSRGGCPR